MEITGLGAKQIKEQGQTITIPLCSCFTVLNYSESVFNLIISDVVIPVAGYDFANNIPGQFDFTPADGNFSNISIPTEFEDDGKIDRVVILYTAKAPQNC